MVKLWRPKIRACASAACGAGFVLSERWRDLAPLVLALIAHSTRSLTALDRHPRAKTRGHCTCYALSQCRALGSRPRVTTGGLVTASGCGRERVSGTDRPAKRGVIPGLTRDPSRDDATAARSVVLGDLAAWGGISRWAPACAGVTSGVRWVWSKGRWLG